MIVFGLGNPGSQYEKTRHNAGFLVVDRIAALEDIAFRKRCFRLILQAKKDDLTLVKPLTFMNKSGEAAKAYKKVQDVKLVVCDNMDLPVGTLRIKMGGHTAGQRGLADVTRVLGPDTIRVYLGTGRPKEGEAVNDHVLSLFSDAEQVIFDGIVDKAASAVLDLAKGLSLDSVQQKYNTKKHEQQ